MFNNENVVITLKTINEKLVNEDKKVIIESIRKTNLTVEEYGALYCVFFDTYIPMAAFKIDNFIQSYFKEAIQYEFMMLSQFGEPEKLEKDILRKIRPLSNTVQIYLILLIKSMNFNQFEKELKKAKLLLR